MVSRLRYRLCIVVLPVLLGCDAFPGLSSAPMDPPEQEAEQTVLDYREATSVTIPKANVNESSPPDSLIVTSGTMAIDTDAATITVADKVYTGTIRQQANGPEVAEFKFQIIDLAAGIDVTTTGSRPLSLIANTTATIAATIDVSGRSANEETGGVGRLGGGSGGFYNANTWRAEPGQGKGGGKLSDDLGPSGPGGGGFGGRGGMGGTLEQWITAGGPGGAAYGDLLSVLEGGSGGGAPTGSVFSRAKDNAPSGGAGGGCIAITAGAAIYVSGTIRADGGKGADAPAPAPGEMSLGTDCPAGAGGSGGGILLNAPEVFFTGILSARGGDAGVTRSSPAGGGGGGRIVIHSAFYNPAMHGTFYDKVNCSGGTSIPYRSTLRTYYGQNGGSGESALVTQRIQINNGYFLSLHYSEVQGIQMSSVATAEWTIESGGTLGVYLADGCFIWNKLFRLNGGRIVMRLVDEELALSSSSITGHGVIGGTVHLANGSTITGENGIITIKGYVRGNGTLTNVDVQGTADP